MSSHESVIVVSSRYCNFTHVAQRAYLTKYARPIFHAKGNDCQKLLYPVHKSARAYMSKAADHNFGDPIIIKLVHIARG